MTMEMMCFKCWKSKEKRETVGPAYYDNYALEPDVEVIYNPNSGALELAPSKDRQKYDISKVDVTSSAVIANPNFLEQDIPSIQKSKSSPERKGLSSPQNSSLERAKRTGSSSPSYENRKGDTNGVDNVKTDTSEVTMVTNKEISSPLPDSEELTHNDSGYCDSGSTHLGNIELSSTETNRPNTKL